jgi:hypothetical protein
MSGAELSDKPGPGAQLAGASLAGRDLSGADLSGADLSGADLTGTDLRRARLDFAKLKGANLPAARLDGASLTGADLDPNRLVARVATPEGDETFGWRTPDGDVVSLGGVIITLEAFARMNTGAGFEARARRQFLLAAFQRLDKATAPTSITALYWRTPWLVGAAPGAGALGLLSGWMAWLVWTGQLGDYALWSRAIWSLLFASFAAILVMASVTYLIALVVRRPVLVIDARGVHDVRLTRSLIAWGDIRSIVPLNYNGEWKVALTLDQPARAPLPGNLLWALNRLSARLLRRPEISIQLKGLQGDVQVVLEALQRAAPD